MSLNTYNTLTKEQLLACLEYDGVRIRVDMIDKAKNNDSEAFRSIGCAYKYKKQEYSKVMAWYRLAVDQNNIIACNDIGLMYAGGKGVLQNYLIAMKYYIKAVKDNYNAPKSNIARLFSHGKGLPFNNYKALEWFIKNGRNPKSVKELNKAVVNLRKEDKNKTIYQLINETEDILREERTKRECVLTEEMEKMKQEMKCLRKEYQKLQIDSQQNQQEKEDIIALLHNLV